MRMKLRNAGNIIVGAGIAVALIAMIGVAVELHLGAGVGTIAFADSPAIAAGFTSGDDRLDRRGRIRFTNDDDADDMQITTPAPESFALLFEAAAVRAFDADLNKRWRLDEDGSVYFAANVAAGEIPYPNVTFFSDTAFPNQPVDVLPATAIDEIRQAIDINGFFDIDAYSVDPAWEGGAALRLTVAEGGQIHSVIVVNILDPALKNITDTINSHLPPALQLETYPLW